MKIFSAILISGVFLTTACTQKENTVIYKGNTYTVYDNRVEQGKFRAVAISKTKYDLIMKALRTKVTLLPYISNSVSIAV